MWCLAPSPNAHHHIEGRPIPRRRSKSHRLPSRPDSLRFCPQGTVYLSKSTGARPDSPWTSHSITMLAHVAPRRRVHYGSVDQHAETPSDAGHSPSYTITPRDSSPVAGRRVDVPCLYIDVAQ